MKHVTVRQEVIPDRIEITSEKPLNKFDIALAQTVICPTLFVLPLTTVAAVQNSGKIV